MKLYQELADWWPLLSAPEEYAEEAAFYQRCLIEVGEGELETVLELGSGGGNNAYHMQSRFALTLVDSSTAMLAISAALNPRCEHVHGDMRSVRLGREFDAVFVHDAICYMTTLADLRGAIETAYAHCRPGGAVLFAPDHVRETFRPSTDCGGNDGEHRALRYLEWTWDPDPEDTTYVVDYAFLLRHADGRVHIEHDRHVEGLFSREQWLQTLEQVGFEARSVPFAHSEVPSGLEVFVGKRTNG